MDKIVFALLRGVCQLPAYVAHTKGFLRDVGIEAELSIAPTAWTVPQRLVDGEVQFAVIPWTRVAADKSQSNRLTLVSGSGFEEAAMVVRNGITVEQVGDVAVPNEGGIKDLTAMALVQRLGWQNANIVRMPSGDGAILSFVGEGADAASMVEPYATMLEHLGLGHVIQRTGDVWPGAPGCSLTTTSNIIAENPSLVERMVSAYMRGARFAETNRDEFGKDRREIHRYQRRDHSQGARCQSAQSGCHPQPGRDGSGHRTDDPKGLYRSRADRLQGSELPGQG